MHVFTCAHCGNIVEKSGGYYSQAKKLGTKVFCNRKCFGLDRRNDETAQEKLQIKSWYDMFIRASMTEEEKIIESINNAIWFQMDYKANPNKYKKQRQKRMPKHVEYCRQPKYKEYKKVYDLNYRANKDYGEYAEAALMLFSLEREINVRQAKKQNELINKSQTRKRSWQKIQAKQTTNSLLAI